MRYNHRVHLKEEDFLSDDIESYYLTNRQISQRGRKQWWYCCKCDRDLVSDIGKCGECGYKPFPKKQKIK